MGLFSNISDFFKSSNSLAKTSHQKHMENVKKSGIKVLEIQRKGTGVDCCGDSRKNEL